MVQADTIATDSRLVGLQYREFWEGNLQKMEDISTRIEKTLLRLEKKYVDFEESYDELTGSIDLLLSIYGSYNNLQGAEYLLKLKACLVDYRHRHTHEGIRFNVLYYLHAKVKELRGGSLEAFPRMKHSLPEKTEPPVGAGEFVPTHRWITFARHGAWFILPYDTVDIVPRERAMLVNEVPAGSQYMAHGDATYPVIDSIPPRERDRGEQPACYIITGGKCYAASSPGRRILAGKDVIGGRLRTYAMSGDKYIRLFGKNHVWLGN